MSRETQVIIITVASLWIAVPALLTLGAVIVVTEVLS
jgi:hypothetical protein